MQEERGTLHRRPLAMASTAESIMRATLCSEVRGTPSCTKPVGSVHSGLKCYQPPTSNADASTVHSAVEVHLHDMHSDVNMTCLITLCLETMHDWAPQASAPCPGPRWW